MNGKPPVPPIMY